jgi:hypothetical protein
MPVLFVLDRGIEYFRMLFFKYVGYIALYVRMAQKVKLQNMKKEAIFGLF